MKTNSKSLFLKLLLLLAFTIVASSHAQDARFFRVTGPVATTITAFTADGYMTWTNEITNATFTVQTATSLGGASNWVDYVRMPVTNGVNTSRLIDFNPPTNMALIPAGSFTMGDTFSEGVTNELPLHTVYVSAFYMDRYEVTKALWDEVYQWSVTNGYSFEYGAAGKAWNHPAQSMTWYDAVKWCNARSEREGKVPAYYTDAGMTTRYRSGQVSLYVNWSGGYRLPTEAEWEKAARGGASGQRFPWGDTISWGQANYYAIPSYYAYDVNPTEGFHPTFNDGVYPYTSPVGYFGANGYGLYDMAGNVWEWCWDWYGGYTSGSQSDPRGPVSGSSRVGRGGSWVIHAFYCRTADRRNDSPSYGYSHVGFRSVLPPGQ
jgi:sulfatase modifying factor 1